MKIKLLAISLLSIFIIFNSCVKTNIGLSNEIKRVKGTPVTIRDIPDEASGFGSLSFLTKIDVVSAQEAVIKKIFYREGDSVKENAILIQLENPQINLLVEKANNNYSQALAAKNLANTKLLEGIFQSEAQLLALEKSEAELALMKKRWEENQRKHKNQETLYNAGGIHTEAFLVSSFSLDTEWEQIQLMEKELEIRKIGCRDQDLIKAGFLTVFENETERMNALVTLMTSGLRAELLAAEARLEAAEKELSSAKIAFSQLTIYSPQNGIIGARYFEEGERVQSQDKIISLMDTESLYAIFPVREKDALRIEKGMVANVLIDGTGKMCEGIVDLVYPQADSQSLSFLVRVLLDNKMENSFLEKLKPGMFAKVSVTVGPSKSVFFIPETSIININTEKNEGTVFVINGTSLSERKVVLGNSYGEDREIISGLNAKEIIVTRPSPDLKEGTNVSLTE